MKNFAIVALVVVIAATCYALGRSGKSVPKNVGDAVGSIKGFYYTQTGNWPEEFRLEHRAEYARFVEQRLKEGVKQYEEQLNKLSKSSAKLQLDIEKRQTILERSKPILDDMLAALEKGEFPVELYDGKYDESQLRAQIGVIVTQRKAASDAVANFTALRDVADKEKARLIHMIDQNNNALAMIDSNVNIIQAKEISEDCKILINNLSEAFDYNANFKSDPVDSLEALINRADNSVEPENADALVNEALEEYRAQKNNDDAK